MTHSILVKASLREGLFTEEAGGLACSLPGSAVTIRFRGQSISALIQDLSHSGKSWINVWIDALAVRAFRVDPENETGEYQLADDLPPGEHVLTLQKRTEAAFGSILLKGFLIPDGALLPPPPAPARRLLMIGDSITCGFGNEAQIPSDVDASRENYALTYGYLASRRLGAAVLSCSASGTGVYQNYGGEKRGRMSDFFMETFCPALDGQALDPFLPDAAVINLGTNDWSAPITEAQYAGRYGELLDFFRARYPRVPLICAIGPMNMGPAPALSALVDRRRQSGDFNLHFLAFPPIQRPADAFGGAGHPSAGKHRAMAELLAQKLRRACPAFADDPSPGADAAASSCCP